MEWEGYPLNNLSWPDTKPQNRHVLQPTAHNSTEHNGSHGACFYP